MHALAASCEELRARTGNPPLVSQGIFGLLLTLFSLIGACWSRTDKNFFPCFPHPVNAEVNTRFPLINDFKPTTDITKFVDDSSIFEVVLQNARSKLDQTLSKTSEWVDRNYMELHGEKNKAIKDYIFRP